ncbi:hypothetical protein CB1_001907076 [Camelus ferus]|nr:hypothetical protein CB1_001907076 [Camelus ferus]
MPAENFGVKFKSSTSEVTRVTVSCCQQRAAFQAFMNLETLTTVSPGDIYIISVVDFETQERPSCRVAGCGEARRLGHGFSQMCLPDLPLQSLVLPLPVQVAFIVSHAVLGGSEIQFEFEGISLDSDEP